MRSRGPSFCPVGFTVSDADGVCKAILCSSVALRKQTLRRKPVPIHFLAYPCAKVCNAREAEIHDTC
jgi:hypothetical protein